MSQRPASFTRRTALRSAAGTAVALGAASALPAWARPILAGPRAVKGPGALPFPNLPEGTASMPQIEHIIVLMMENHTFDNLLGALPHAVKARHKVDGLTFDKHGKATNTNPATDGSVVRASRSPTPCQFDSVTQTWAASHDSYDGGKMDGFAKASGKAAMLYFDQTHMPFSYSLASTFPIGDHYFSSVLAQTYPNRRFLFCGTADGLIATDGETFKVPASNGTIWDRLDAHQISWKTYYTNEASMVIVPNIVTPDRGPKIVPIAQFYKDAKAGTLPQFSMLDPEYDTQSEENPQDIQVGEEFMAKVVNAVMDSPNWDKTVLFINYDEGGGYYDHVPPPSAIAPDATPPMLAPTDPPGGYDRYGFRVPMYVVSPWARRNYVSRIVADHTSVLAFIERKWNLGAMTMRDANAHDLTDYFDFTHAAFRHPPKLAAAPTLTAGLAKCKAEGFDPPLPGQKNPSDPDGGV